MEFVHDHGEVVTRLGRLAEGKLALGIFGKVAMSHARRFAFDYE
jgi:hypothetical protein